MGRSGSRFNGEAIFISHHVQSPQRGVEWNLRTVDAQTTLRVVLALECFWKGCDRQHIDWRRAFLLGDLLFGVWLIVKIINTDLRVS